jgi:hypothetical protein
MLRNFHTWTLFALIPSPSSLSQRFTLISVWVLLSEHIIWRGELSRKELQSLALTAMSPLEVLCAYHSQDAPRGLNAKPRCVST